MYKKLIYALAITLSLSVTSCDLVSNEILDTETSVNGKGDPNPDDEPLRKNVVR